MYHKIRNVDKAVCTAEQVVAYNIASAYGNAFREDYKAAKTDKEREAIVEAAVARCTLLNPKSKYDSALILDSLRAGMGKYLSGNSIVCFYYEDIGRIFPAEHLSSKA